MSGKGIKHISAGVCHCAASNATLPVKGVSNISVPAAVPAQFTALRDVSCEAAYARLMLLNYFSKLISKSWALFSVKKVSQLEPLISYLSILGTDEVSLIEGLASFGDPLILKPHWDIFYWPEFKVASFWGSWLEGGVHIERILHLKTITFLFFLAAV